MSGINVAGLAAATKVMVGTVPAVKVALGSTTLFTAASGGITFDSYNPGIANSYGTWPHAMGSGSGGVLLVPVFSFGEYDVPTYNGVAMTLLCGFLHNGSWPYRLYGLLNPTPGENGVDLEGTTAAWAASYSWTGVASFGDAEIGTAPPTGLSISSAAGDVVVMVIDPFQGTAAVDSGFTARGTWCVGTSVEESAGAATVTGATANLGVSLVAA
jgi:hypothetical protein